MNFSNNFKSFLSKYYDTEVYNSLSKIYDNRDFLYIGMNDKEGYLSFIPNKKEYKDSVTYKIVNQNTIDLSHEIFNNTFLNVDKSLISIEEYSDEPYRILGYYKASNSSYQKYDDEYVIIHLVNIISNKQVVYIKSLTNINDNLIMLNVDSYKKSEIKIGRFLKKITDLKDNEIEKFVNLYKSDMIYNNLLMDKLQIVKGDEIKYWYSGSRYADNVGNLSGSCMKTRDSQSYFKIYTENDNVSMLILKDDEGALIGRALLWENATLHDETDKKDVKYMDRIYSQDHIIVLFSKWANDNGYIYYNNDDNKSQITVDIDVDLSYNFPYMDSFIYMTTEDIPVKMKATLSTKSPFYKDEKSYHFQLTNTNGSYSKIYN